MRCLVVEDAPPGIAAGLASGAVVIGVATSHDASHLTGSHVLLDDLTACAMDLQPGGVVVRMAGARWLGSHPAKRR